MGGSFHITVFVEVLNTHRFYLSQGDKINAINILESYVTKYLGGSLDRNLSGNDKIKSIYDQMFSKLQQIMSTYQAPSTVPANKKYVDNLPTVEL